MPEYDYTDLELLVQDALDALGVYYITQYPTPSGFVLDIVIPPNLVIEVDGPSHDGSRNRRRDRFRDMLLKLEGWRVHRVGYNVVADPDRLAYRLGEILARS
jgi:very-short-patch-repair endonuclease